MLSIKIISPILSTLGRLTQLRKLFLSSNPITVIRPLANLVNLERLSLSWSETLVDIRPLANLTKLRILSLHHNKIRDVTPLAGLHNLEVLNVSNNDIVDHSPLDNLQLQSFIYDQECDVPHIPALPRIENRTFPSVFGAFIPTTLNQPHQSQVENIAQHDMLFSAPVSVSSFLTTATIGKYAATCTTPYYSATSCFHIIRTRYSSLNFECSMPDARNFPRIGLIGKGTIPAALKVTAAFALLILQTRGFRI